MNGRKAQQLRRAIAQLWWPGYVVLGTDDFTAAVAEDGWHVYDYLSKTSHVGVGDDYVRAWDWDRDIELEEVQRLSRF